MYWPRNRPSRGQHAYGSRSKRPILSAPEPGKWVGQKLTNTVVLATASAHEEGIAQGVGMDGAERVYAVRRLSGAQTPGFVYIGLPAEHIFGEAKVC